MCVGPCKKIFHWGPLTALTIIKCVTGMTIHCSSMWWPPDKSTGGLLNFSCFMTLSVLTLYNFMCAIFVGPGYLPLKWKPGSEEDCQYLQWCSICQGYKAPRSHHCRKCDRCVLKMDHHCPWINGCVGWSNHAHFTAFLGFAVLGCLHGSIVLSCSLYRGINRVWYLYYGTGNEPVVYLGLYSLILCVFALGLAIGVVLAVGMLLFLQVRAIMRNRTGIEDWILEKANHRRSKSGEHFKFPYDLGLKKNIFQVVNITCHPIGDGIKWEVANDCDQFTLTREQIEQKNEKRQRTKTYTIIQKVSGSWFPITKGLKVCLQPPCSDEPRLKLQPGDMVKVTRWRKHWLFGEKIVDENAQNDVSVHRLRGWFPRCTAVEFADDTVSNKHFEGKKNK